MSEPSIRDNIRRIIEEVPSAGQDQKLLMLLYWMAVDDIEIPPEVVKDILSKGTNPVSIWRRRFKDSGRRKRKGTG